MKITKIKLVIFAVTLSAITGCMSQAQLVKQTASGYPEGVFKDAKVEDVKPKLIEGCSKIGAMVAQADNSQVVCQKTMEGGDAVLAQLLIGNSYSTTPVSFVRFVMYPSGNDVKVTGYQWIETQMAFGQVNRQELKGNNHINDLQNFLFSIGAY